MHRTIRYNDPIMPAGIQAPRYCVAGGLAVSCASGQHQGGLWV
ncbi:hypothetical protein ASZ90_010373 [hydrocarbon metagenome]|uniref:Uncharacterized protein n=1 Tax=hydrocarbon metagenome TaxID=938273 RepID=A0A0W8FGB5_9ZZZZ